MHTACLNRLKLKCKFTRPLQLTGAKTHCLSVQHAVDNGWFLSPEGKPKLVALLSSAHEASLGVAQLHRQNIVHGGICPASCFLKAARNQRGFVVKVGVLVFRVQRINKLSVSNTKFSWT